eukprot:5138835-Alexandrium_andersonii.AAC.1
MHCTPAEARSCIAAGVPVPTKKKLFMAQRDLCGSAAAERATTVLAQHGGSLESAEAAVHGA